MFANATETPRPRPPAKVRRSTSNIKAATTPPPAYGSPFTYPDEGRPRLDTLLGSPMAATFQMVGWDAEAGSRANSVSPEKDELDWVNEKSREELAELLVKADDLIKERENELGLTSAVVKSLYESNVSLKTKHRALLARLPVSSSQSSSPVSSPAHLPHTPSRTNDITYDDSPSDSVFGVPSPSKPLFRRHMRKVSVSTHDISLLADQNAELLDKLEKLETEATSADQTSRRELKRLEKEISILREELEKTQARSEEIEEKAKVGFGWGAEKAVEEAWKKKQQREAKFRAMRNLGRNFNSDGSHGVQNFAPEGSPFGGPSSGFSFFSTGRESDDVFESHNSSDAPLSFELYGSHPPEHALISQLLSKIQELESANTKIVEQQIQTANQLQSMQRETENINKVYECLADSNEVQLELETDELRQRTRTTSPNSTIRFRSLRRKLENEPSITLSSGRDRQNRYFSGSSKARKSVVGLFDDSEESSGANLSAPFLNTSRSESHHRSSSSLGSNGLASPALSTLSIFSPHTPALSELSPAGDKHTLAAELEDELTGSWGMNLGNYHVQTTNLLSDLNFSLPASPTPSRLPHTDLHDLSVADDEDDHTTSVSFATGDLRLSAEPPNLVNSEDSETAATPKSPRYQRMTQTVRSRTSGWVDRRFKRTLTGAISRDNLRETKINKSHTLLQSVLPHNISNAIDTMVENITALTVNPEIYDEPQSPSLSQSDAGSPTVLEPEVAYTPATPVTAKESRALLRRGENPRNNLPKHGFSAFLLELWLWLQFFIIILVFLWAMAKRGPKSIIAEADNRRAVTRRH